MSETDKDCLIGEEGKKAKKELKYLPKFVKRGRGRFNSVPAELPIPSQQSKWVLMLRRPIYR